MNKKELIEAIVEGTGVPTAVVKSVVEAHTTVVIDELLKNQKFRMTDIGTFELVRKDNCEIRQPNGDPIKYKTHYRPRLKFSKRIKETAAMLSTKRGKKK